MAKKQKGVDRNASGGKDKSSSDWVCCCPAKTGGVVVAFVELLLCVLAVICLFINLNFFGASYLFWFIVGLISILIILIAIILLLYAIKKESDRLLIPHLSAQIFLIGWLLIVVIVVAILLAFGAYRGVRNLVGTDNYYISDEATRWLGFQIIVLHLAIACLEIFFLYIIWKLYKSFRAKAKASGTSTTLLGKKKSGHVHPPANGDWYKPGQNPRAYGGSPEAGDIYPYDAPIV